MKLSYRTALPNVEPGLWNPRGTMVWLPVSHSRNSRLRNFGSSSTASGRIIRFHELPARYSFQGRRTESDGIQANPSAVAFAYKSEEHTSELQSRVDLVCRLLLEKKK